MKTFLSHFKWDIGLAVVLFVTFLVSMGIDAAWHYFTLGVLEVSFSFDNAVVNALILVTMSVAWQKRFMTWGILVAVVGMRFLFPVVIVMLTAHLGFVEVIRLAFAHPTVYAHDLTAATPQITILGFTYLGMLFLNWVLAKRDPLWLTYLERPLAKIGGEDRLPYAIMVALILVAGAVKHNTDLWLYGGASIVLFSLVSFIGDFFEGRQETLEEDKEKTVSGQVVLKTGIAGFFAFMYLEVQDAAFSFDGVSGAFAITNDIKLIMAGLGIGAVVIRTLTYFLVKGGVLKELTFLEHGAMWAIGTLAACMFLKLFVEVPDYVTGLIGVIFIGAAFYWSKTHGVVEEIEEALESSDDTNVVNLPAQTA